MSPIADNSTQTGSDTIATDDVATLNGGASSGVKVQRAKIGYGDDGDYRDASATYPLPVLSSTPALTSTSGAIAAAATGTVGPADVSRAGNVSFIVKNTVAASAWAGAPVLVFEQSDDNTSWAPIVVVRSDTGQAGSTFTLGAGTANGSLVFEAAVEAVNYVRVRVTTGPTTNGLTINIQAGSLSFIQGSTIIASAVDGARASYHTISGGAYATTGNCWSFTNPSGSGKLMRLTWFRFNMIGSTAGATIVDFKRLNSGTVSGGTVNSTASAFSSDPVAPLTGSAVIQSYSAAATGAGQLIREFRYYAKLAAADQLSQEYTFGNRGGQALLLRPNMSFLLSIATAVTGGNFTIETEHTEEPI